MPWGLEGTAAAGVGWGMPGAAGLARAFFHCAASPFHSFVTTQKQTVCGQVRQVNPPTWALRGDQEDRSIMFRLKQRTVVGH